MVTARLSREDAKERGWLLDGYPRSSAQAQSLEKLKIIPDIYVVLDVRVYFYAGITEEFFNCLISVLICLWTCFKLVKILS